MATSELNSHYSGQPSSAGRHRLSRLDVSAEHAARQWADDESRLFREIIRHLPEGVALTRASDGLFIYVNPTFAQMLGHEPGELVGHSSDLVQHRDVCVRERLVAEIAARLAAGAAWVGDMELLRYDGSTFWCHCTVVSFEHHEYGLLWLSLYEDITERVQAENALRSAHTQLQTQMSELRDLHEQLRDMAIRDPLTQLYNRRYLHETLPREVARAERGDYYLAALMIDIDHFKLVNDTFGHVAGDEVLQEVARLVMASLRASDIACRYGGEEILCMLLDANVAVATRRAEDLRGAIAQLQVLSAHPETRVTVSIGVAVFPANGGSIGDAILAADQALYRAKDAGRNCVRFANERAVC